MAFRSFKKDIDKFYQRIDKIAKQGRDNFQEYYDYVDDCIFKQQYAILTQVLYIKYDFDYTKYYSVDQVKSRSWSAIMFRTNTGLQDDKYKLLKNNSLYQIGLDIWLERVLTKVNLIDPNEGGFGADFNPVIANDTNRGILRIDVLKPGKDYSTASYIVVTGGDPSATATPFIRGGQVLKVDMGASGSNHNVDIKLGRVQEFDLYVASVEPLAYTDNIYQQNTDNKVAYLLVTKEGATMSASFSNWNFSLTYDKNVINLYTEAINYLI
jgi:hypothetical protein